MGTTWRWRKNYEEDTLRAIAWNVVRILNKSEDHLRKFKTYEKLYYLVNEWVYVYNTERRVKKVEHEEE